MQRFLISPILLSVVSWVLLLLFAEKTQETGILQVLVFTILLFLAISFTLSLIIYFARNLIAKIAARGKIKFEEDYFVDLRPLWRRSFKMASIISAFIAVLAFLKLEELLNLFNFGLLIIIIILGAIWLRS